MAPVAYFCQFPRLQNTLRVETLTDAVDIEQWIMGAQSWDIDRKKVKDSLTTAFFKDVFQVYHDRIDLIQLLTHL